LVANSKALYNIVSGNPRIAPHWKIPFWRRYMKKDKRAMRGGVFAIRQQTERDSGGAERRSKWVRAKSRILHREPEFRPDFTNPLF